MKKFFVFLFLVVFTLILSSCKREELSAVDEPVVRSIEPEFFYTVTHKVISGDNTWDRAKYFYGSGFKWTDIVSQNEFLQKPGRVWRDKVTGIWYCLILPGEVLNIGTTQINPIFTENVITDSGTYSDGMYFGLPWWVWLTIVLIFLALIFGYIQEEKDKKNEAERKLDPITSGKPQVSGGVPDSGAHQRAAKIIEQRYPSATFVVTKIYRGKLSGPAQIYYDGELQPKERILDNIDAYEGISMVNGKEETIYFLQGCGNDARFGNFMTGSNLIFTRTVEIGQDGSEISSVQESSVVNEAGIKEEVKNEVEVEKPKATEVIGSELYRTISSHVLLAEDFLKNQTAHKVTLKVTTPQGTVETILETKIEAKQDKKTNEEGSKK